MRIAIVGNARPKRDYSDEIDQCDLIIRFNRAPHMPFNWVGYRAVVHCFINALPVGRMLAAQTVPAEALAAPIIWWLSYNDETREAITVNHNLGDKAMLHYRDVCNGQALRILLGDCDANPSSGLRAIYMCQCIYPIADISLLTFTWEGSEWHRWDLERELCSRWQLDGKLAINP